jgi:hypothetical protein
MDEDVVRSHVQAHGEAMVAGDLRRAGADLTESGRAGAGTVMAALPKAIESAELVSLEPAGDCYLARIRYRGEGRQVEVRSRWEERDGRPMITELGLA